MCWFKVYRVINSFLLFCTYSNKSFIGKACACFSMFGGVGGIPSSRSNTLNQLLNLFFLGGGGVVIQIGEYILTNTTKLTYYVHIVLTQTHEPLDRLQVCTTRCMHVQSLYSSVSYLTDVNRKFSTCFIWVRRTLHKGHTTENFMTAAT